MSFTVLVSADGKLATKQHVCDESGATTTIDYDKGYWWHPKRMPFSGFYEMVASLEGLLEAPHAQVIKAEPKPGLDQAKLIRRKYLGPDAAFDDVAGWRVRHRFPCAVHAFRDVGEHHPRAEQHSVGDVCIRCGEAGDGSETFGGSSGPVGGSGVGTRLVDHA